MFSGGRESRSRRFGERAAAWRGAFVVVAACLLACTPDRASERGASPTSHASIQVIDDAGNVVHLERPARRIVSLVPSVTETLIALGAASAIVGRTRYDTAPLVAALPSVGGGVDASVEAIINLRPDLVVAWSAESRGTTRERLVALGIPVVVVKTEDTTDVFRGIATMGRLTGRDSAATAVATSVRRDLDAVRRAVAGHPTPTVLYVVYTDPPMTAGPRTFIGQLLSLAGGKSVFTDSSRLWPNVAMEEIVRRDPDLLLVPVGDQSPKPLDHLRALNGWRDLRAVRAGHVVAVPADVMSRPSPIIAQAARVLLAAMHPEITTDSAGRSP